MLLCHVRVFNNCIEFHFANGLLTKKCMDCKLMNRWKVILYVLLEMSHWSYSYNFHPKYIFESRQILNYFIDKFLLESQTQVVTPTRVILTTPTVTVWLSKERHWQVVPSWINHITSEWLPCLIKAQNKKCLMVCFKTKINIIVHVV